MAVRSAPIPCPPRRSTVAGACPAAARHDLVGARLIATHRLPMSSFPAHLDRGAPYPLGATWDGLGTNFAVFSAHAERIELCLFDPTGRREIARFDLPECTDEIWHGYLPDARLAWFTGTVPMDHIIRRTVIASTPTSLLLDPYARRFAGSLRWSDALFGYRLHSPRARSVIRPP